MKEGSRVIEIADKIMGFFPYEYTLEPQVARGRIVIRSPDFMFFGNLVSKIVPILKDGESFYFLTENDRVQMVIF